MPARRRRQLTFRLEQLLRLFPALWRGGDASPLRRYVQDLPDEVASDGDAMFGAIERRTCAIPEPGSRGGGLAEAHSGVPARHVDDLDAASEADRALIMMIGLGERGVPRRRFAPYLAISPPSPGRLDLERRAEMPVTSRPTMSDWMPSVPS